jgi:hypothetical protein
MWMPACTERAAGMSASPFTNTLLATTASLVRTMISFVFAGIGLQVVQTGSTSFHALVRSMKVFSGLPSCLPLCPRGQTHERDTERLKLLEEHDQMSAILRTADAAINILCRCPAAGLDVRPEAVRVVTSCAIHSGTTAIPVGEMKPNR